MTISNWLWLGSAVLALMGLWAWLRTARGFGKWLVRALGTGLLLGAAVLASLGVLLRNYTWLIQDVPVATIELAQLGTQRYQATLTVGDDAPRSFVLLGDEWLLDARVVRWKLPAQLAGLPPVYRIERLSGRYGDPKQELEDARSVHDLREDWDFLSLRERHFRWLSLVDARWGSSAYLPMLDGATYQVFVNPRGGLVAKPADAQTQRLLDEAGW